MAILPEAERIFLKLAEMYGKKTVPFESIKGRTAVPEEYTGAWVLLERSDGRLSIAEIAGTQVTVRDLKFPLGAIAFEPIDFPAAVDMAMYAVREYLHVYSTLPVRHIPEEIYGAKLPQVTVGGITYYRDDVRREFREVGKPENRISFEEWPERWIKAEFTGNIATIRSSLGFYETTNQRNAIQAISNWLHSGILAPYEAGPETKKLKGKHTNRLSVEKTRDAIAISDSRQRKTYKDVSKAISAVRSWVYSGQLP